MIPVVPEVLAPYSVVPLDGTYPKNDVGIEWHCNPFADVTAVDVPTYTMFVADVDEFQNVTLHNPGGIVNKATVFAVATGILFMIYATNPLKLLKAPMRHRG